ncbi:hypothetical protein K440DRAFT_635340 [Wilcoxina mikolae CBS 423.85]|nr:hypothetical protein K440DRAFT_635340 [Wilcoxina mikolae CBS 423.85]
MLCGNFYYLVSSAPDGSGLWIGLGAGCWGVLSGSAPHYLLGVEPGPEPPPAMVSYIPVVDSGTVGIALELVHSLLPFWCHSSTLDDVISHARILSPTT